MEIGLQNSEPKVAFNFETVQKLNCYWNAIFLCSCCPTQNAKKKFGLLNPCLFVNKSAYVKFGGYFLIFNAFYIKFHHFWNSPVGETRPTWPPHVCIVNLPDDILESSTTWRVLSFIWMPNMRIGICCECLGFVFHLKVNLYPSCFWRESCKC